MRTGVPSEDWTDSPNKCLTITLRQAYEHLTHLIRVKAVIELVTQTNEHSVGRVSNILTVALLKCPGYDTKLNLVLRLQFWWLESKEYHFIAITPRSILTRIGGTS